MFEKSTSLSHELEELFDIRFARDRDEKKLNQEAMDAQRDIRLLIHMFRDGVPDITITLNADEAIKWDGENKELFYIEDGSSQILLGTSRQTMIRVRPYLSKMVKAAKSFYKA